jgi:hypothetical protein
MRIHTGRVVNVNLRRVGPPKPGRTPRHAGPCSLLGLCFCVSVDEGYAESDQQEPKANTDFPPLIMASRRPRDCRATTLPPTLGDRQLLQGHTLNAQPGRNPGQRSGRLLAVGYSDDSEQVLPAGNHTLLHLRSQIRNCRDANDFSSPWMATNLSGVLRSSVLCFQTRTYSIDATTPDLEIFSSPSSDREL